MVKRLSDKPPGTISQMIEITKRSRRARFAVELMQLIFIMALIGVIIGLFGLAQKLAGGNPW